MGPLDPRGGAVPSAFLLALLIRAMPLYFVLFSRYVSEEVERCQRLFEEKEGRLRAANESATKEAETAARQRDQAQR